MQYFYNSMCVLLTPDSSVSLVDSSAGVKHAILREHNAVQVSGIIF